MDIAPLGDFKMNLMFFSNTLMFFLIIRLIEKIIRTFEAKHTVDYRQTPIVCRQSTVCLSTIISMFFLINLMILKNIGVFLKNIKLI